MKNPGVGSAHPHARHFDAILGAESRDASVVRVSPGRGLPSGRRVLGFSPPHRRECCTYRRPCVSDTHGLRPVLETVIPETFSDRRTTCWRAHLHRFLRESVLLKPIWFSGPHPGRVSTLELPDARMRAHAVALRWGERCAWRRARLSTGPEKMYLDFAPHWRTPGALVADPA